jgi:hypothetical protein
MTAPQAPPLTVILIGSRLKRREYGPFPQWRAWRERGSGNWRGLLPAVCRQEADAFAPVGVQDRLHVSGAVVSKALARSAAW